MGIASNNNARFSNPFVDALVEGDRWRDGDTIALYLQPSSLSLPSWSDFGASTSIAAAAAAWNAVADVHYMVVSTQAEADFVEKLYSNRKTNADGTVTLGEHYFPNNQQLGGQYNVDSGYYTTANIAKGGLMYETFLHELGHGLGLDHPFNGDQLFPGVTRDDSSDTGDNDLNSQLYTVMTYNDVSEASGDSGSDAYGNAESPMAFDIAAAQAIYGANMATATGNDTYVLPGSNGAGTGWTCIWDAGGTDTISAAGSDLGCTIDLNAATLADAPGGGGNVSRENTVYGGFTIAHGVTIENAIGGLNTDTLIGNEADNRLDGGGGSDSLYGGAGHDTFVVDALAATASGQTETVDIGDYQPGVDTIDISALRPSFVNVQESVGPDRFDMTFTVSGGEVRLTGRGGLFDIAQLGGADFFYRLSGSEHGDALAGTDRGDALIGYAGNDRLSGLAGDDTLDGGADNDTLDGGSGRDTLTGGAGNDVLIVDSVHDTIVEAANGGTDTVQAAVSWTLGDNLENLLLTGTRGNSGTGNALANTITGNGGDNHLSGLAGDDRLEGAAGDDTLDGGTGHDTMTGGAGNDTYLVDSAHDTLVEGANGGIDTVRAVLNWTLADNLENLVLTGTAGVSGTGNALANAITGNDGGNALAGLTGDDALAGGGGTDRLDGGAGDDTLTGGLGVDLLTGGAGNDRFVFASAAEFGSTKGANADRIADFATGDKIDLHLIDARPGGRDDAFAFIGQSAFDGHAGEVRFYIQSGATYVQGDIDGDKATDFSLKLDGVHALQATVFIL